jgi:hypothetical protein
MKGSSTLKQRMEIEAEMTKVFKEEVRGFSTELQRIMVDDLTTVFQNRTNVSMRVQSKRSY